MIRRKRKTKEEIEENKQKIEKRNKLFLSIWNKRKHYCQSCGKWLGNTILTYFFDHLLEKGLERYKHLEFEEDNIFLVCGDCHSCKGNGFPKPKHKEAIERAKIKFNIK